MALFGFSDITFNKGTPQRNSPLGALVGDEFKTNTYRYPLDLGNADKGHYMVIYIRQQKDSAYKTDDVLQDSAIQQTGKYTAESVMSVMNGKPGVAFAGEINSRINSGLSQLNQATNGVLGGLTSTLSKGLSEAVTGIESGINNLFGDKNVHLSGDSASTQKIIDTSIKKITGGSRRFDALKKTELTSDAIALYMPDTLVYSSQQSYSDLTPGTEIAGQLVQAGADLLSSFNEGNTDWKSAFIKGAKIFADRQAQKLGQTGALAVYGATGVVTNPMLELIYQSPSFRTFQFDFMFYPRDEREALETQRIIERLKFHQAPEFSDTFGVGFLIPPSEFDIKFYYAGKENPNIPQIATCVLTSIDVNYAPQGFSAYEVPNENFPSLGRTGMPVAIQLTLQFKEVTYLTKEDFKESDGVAKPSLARN